MKKKFDNRIDASTSFKFLFVLSTLKENNAEDVTWQSTKK